MAAAAWCEVAKHEERMFLRVPRKERNGWKVFLFSLHCVQYSVQYLNLSLLESIRFQG